MKKVFALVLLGVCGNAFAHDEGNSSLAESGKQLVLQLLSTAPGYDMEVSTSGIEQDDHETVTSVSYHARWTEDRIDIIDGELGDVYERYYSVQCDFDFRFLPATNQIERLGGFCR